MPEKRWLSGHGYNGTYFGNAIKKYGWKNIKHEILFTGLDELDAKQKEVELIEEFRSFEREYGYNCTKGGDGTVGRKNTKDQIQQLKELLGKPVYQRELDGTFIKKWGSIREAERETGIKRQNITACCHKKVSTANGYLWSFDKDYIGKKKQRKDCKKVYQYAFDGKLIKIWNSLSEINEILGYSKTNISHCCLGEANSAYGYIWSYALKDNVNYSNFNKIYQFTKDMKLIKIWNSISDIEIELGYNRSSIYQCCKCKYKTAYGYIWRYVNDVEKSAS